MRIIQSYAQFNEGSPYIKNNGLGEGVIYLNFYTFLLSHLTLKKYYGHVTMYCNESAYNTFIKFIPYDNIIIRNNDNDIEFWNKYKVDVIAQQNEDFIHVDSDVFIFDDVFRPFCDSTKYDIIVQDVLSPDLNFVKNFIHKNSLWLLNNGVFNSNIYDDRCFSCGTLGLRKEHIEKYVKMGNLIYDGFKNNQLYSDSWPKGMILEELVLYMASLENNLKHYDIIPYNEIMNVNNGVRSLGLKYKYTHMWFSSKFVKSNIDLIKNKIKAEFGGYYKIVEKYDEYISGFNVKYLEYKK